MNHETESRKSGAMENNSKVPSFCIMHAIICLFWLIYFPTIVISETTQKDVCFNYYIVTKKTSDYSESTVYQKQKALALKQIAQTQLVFDKNREQNCPEIRFTQGIIKRITWKEALRLSYPLDKNRDESAETYRERKLIEATDEIQAIAKNLTEKPNIKYDPFIEIRPGRAIIKAERALLDIINMLKVITDGREKGGLEKLQSMTRIAIDEVKDKLESYTNKPKGLILKRAKIIISKYEKIDQLSAQSWREGVLTFWNDKEAQDISIEVKNMLRYYRTPVNQCLDVYIVPSGKSPSRHKKEIQKNGDWTSRGGAALSSKNFPRTTGGRGHAILLTHNAKISEYSLAHEFGHLLIDVGDAHWGKKSKDLMHENSFGGSYLNEDEYSKIRENVVTFSGGTKR